MDQRQATYLKLMGIQPWCKQEDLPAIKAMLHKERIAKQQNVAQQKRAQAQADRHALMESLRAQKEVKDSHIANSFKTDSTATSLQRQELSSPVDKRVSAPKEGSSLNIIPAYQPFDSIFDPTFQEALQACRSCYLGAHRQKAVSGVGSKDASIAVITDLPLKSEEQEGKPIEPQLRPLLERAFNQVKIPQSSLYYTPFIKCRPGELMDVTETEQEACSYFLAREMGEIAPAILFLLGRNVTKLLLKKNLPISALRGEVHNVKIGEKRYRAVVSHSPNMLTKRAHYKRNFWQDLKFLRSALGE